MHQTRKGNQWYFGMKAHFGVDSKSKVIHAVVATAANVHDATVLPDLLHGSETRVWGDQAYQGQRAAIHEHAPAAKDVNNRRIRRQGTVDEAERAKNRTKSKVRAKVEHTIGVIKRVFGFSKVRYRGLEKNAQRTSASFRPVARVHQRGLCQDSARGRFAPLPAPRPLGTAEPQQG